MEQKQNYSQIHKTRLIDIENHQSYVKNPVEIFISYMNQIASDHGLSNTKYVINS
jgi:hypothetical protein